MTAIAIPQPLGVPDWVKWPALGLLLGWLLQFTVVTSNPFQVDIITADYFIDCDSGSDGANGTSAGTAWQTLEHAENNVSAGDVIWIKGTCPGNYAVNATFGEVLRLGVSGPSGTAGNLITWKGWPGESNQMGDGADDDTVFTMTTNGADYHRFEGLNFVGSSNSCFYNVKHFEPLDPSVGIEILNSTFTRCAKGFVVENETDCMNSFGHDGIVSHGTTEDFLIDSNRLDQIGRSVSDFVRTTICDPLGNSNNHLYRHDHPLHLKGVGVVAINNVITNYSAGLGIKIDGYIDTTILAEGEFSHIIINNTIGPNISKQPYDRCSGRPIAMARSSLTPRLEYPKFKVENNIMIDSIPEFSIDECESPLRVITSSQPNIHAESTCKNNIYVRSGAAGYIDALSVCQEHDVDTVYGAGKVSGNTLNAAIADLEFTDEDNFDYHIGATSIAIDAGLNEGDAPDRDFDSKVRTGDPDTGAFEQ